MLVLNGKKVSEEKRNAIKKEVESFVQEFKRPPGLSVVLIGNDTASEVYVKNKHKACESVGIKSEIIRLDKEEASLKIYEVLAQLNSDDDVDGILVQLPLPEDFDKNTIIQLIDPIKDVDALTIENIGLMWSGKPRVTACTPSGVIEILDYYNIPIRGKDVVVVGRSLIVGRPMAYLLDSRGATVTVCHSKTQDLKRFTSKADIVVVAAGSAHFLGREFFRKGSTVIDVGIHREYENGKNKLVGDVRFHELEGLVYAATPVPGGVGPMTITMLLQNTLDLAKLRLNDN